MNINYIIIACIVAVDITLLFVINLISSCDTMLRKVVDRLDMLYSRIEFTNSLLSNITRSSSNTSDAVDEMVNKLTETSNRIALNGAMKLDDITLAQFVRKTLREEIENENH